jgi:hypothetical protein
MSKNKLIEKCTGKTVFYYQLGLKIPDIKRIETIFNIGIKNESTIDLDQDQKENEEKYKIINDNNIVIFRKDISKLKAILPGEEEIEKIKEIKKAFCYKPVVKREKNTFEKILKYFNVKVEPNFFSIDNSFLTIYKKLNEVEECKDWQFYLLVDSIIKFIKKNELNMYIFENL